MDDRYLSSHSYAYQEQKRQNYAAQHSAASYREKYLDLRKAVRLYFKGEVTEGELKKLAGWKS